MHKKNIVVLISGAGSNMAAIVRTSIDDDWEKRWGLRVAAVISNRADAGGIEAARKLGVPTAVVSHRAYPGRAEFEAALAEEIDRQDPDGRPALVVLAGFMRILTPEFVARYAGRLVNIHPSLLPAFPGLETHQRALDAGCRVAGATVHLVTEQLDAGPILAQAVVPVVPGDSAQSLAARVVTQEHRIYPEAIRQLLLEGN